MSITGLLNQTITIQAKSGYGANGRETVGASVSVKGRVQLKAKRVLLPNGSTVTIDGVAYVPSTTTVDTDYKVTYLGVSYKVVARYAVPDQMGSTHHIKLELVKWR